MNKLRALAGRLFLAERKPSLEQLRPQGPEGVRILGHRRYVGGMWREIGELQFNYLLSRGLKPEHYMLDVACGSLRGGVHFIQYLQPGHYLGIEKEQLLLKAGIEEELGQKTFDEKKPELVVSSTFEFDKFTARPNFAIAQSLFTHLPQDLIAGCFEKLRNFLREDGCFYATYYEVAAKRENPSQANDHGGFYYTREQMCQFGESAGWRFDYIGDWSHPRGQIMTKYTPI